MYDQKIKDGVIKRVMLGELIKDVSEDTGVSIGTIRRWVKEYKEKMDSNSKSITDSEKGFLQLVLDEDNLLVNVDRLIREGLLDAVLKLFDNEEFKYNANMQIMRINILINLDRLEEALCLCESLEFLKNKEIRLLQRRILNMMLNKKRMQLKMDLIRVLKNRLDSQQDIQSNEMPIEVDNKIKKANSASLLRDIYNNKILTQSDLDSINVNDLERIILTVALYDKQNLPLNILFKYLKEKLVEYSEEEEVFKLIQSLFLKMKSKRRIFDLEHYKNLLVSVRKYRHIISEAKDSSLARKKPNGDNNV